MATSLIQTRFDVGTESTILGNPGIRVSECVTPRLPRMGIGRVVKSVIAEDLMARIARGVPNVLQLSFCTEDDGL